MDKFTPDYEIAKSWNVFLLATSSCLAIPPVLFLNQHPSSDEEKEKILSHKKELFLKFKTYIHDIDDSLPKIKEYIETVSKSLE